MLGAMRYSMLMLGLVAVAAQAATTTAPGDAQPADVETVVRSPAARVIPSAPIFRFEPKGDITSEELDRLKPYLSGKPLHAEDQKDLGTAMRHLRALN
jgi:hypothetical protein